MDLLVSFELHKISHCDSSIVIFDGCWIKIIIYKNKLVYKGLKFWKQLGRQYLLFKSCSCLGIIMNLHLYKEKLFVNIF